MDSVDLKSFVAVSKTMHFGRAARMVHLSPSALTRSIQRLEQELGHELFIRDRRKVELSPAGKLFGAFAEKTLDDFDKCRAVLDANIDELSGKLSIYSSVTATYTILQKVLRPFRNQYPGVHVHLSTGTVADAIGRVQDKAVDCAVAAMPDRLPAGIAFAPLTTTTMIGIAPKGFENVPVYHRDGTVDFARTPLIMPDKDVAREHQTRWFESQKISPAIYAEVAGNEAIIAMVSLGFGIGFVPGMVLNQSPLKHSVQELNFSLPLSPYAIGVVFLEKRRTDPLISAFCHVSQVAYSE